MAQGPPGFQSCLLLAQGWVAGLCSKSHPPCLNERSPARLLRSSELGSVRLIVPDQPAAAPFLHPGSLRPPRLCTHASSFPLNILLLSPLQVPSFPYLRFSACVISLRKPSLISEAGTGGPCLAGNFLHHCAHHTMLSLTVSASVSPGR